MRLRDASIGLALLGVMVAAALGAPVLAPYAPDRQFRGLLNAPPTLPHLGTTRARGTRRSSIPGR